jgi:hypothetical protein
LQYWHLGDLGAPPGRSAKLLKAREEGPKVLACAICISCVGEGYRRSTYDGYGIGSIDGEGKVVDDSISLHHTMVWLRFFVWWGQKSQFLPRPTGQREHGSECNHEKRPQLLRVALQDSAIIQNIAGKFPVHVWG